MVPSVGSATYSIQGRLIDPGTGRLPEGEGMVLDLIPRDAIHLSRVDTFPTRGLPPDGTFEIPNVMPGRYWLGTRSSKGSVVVPVDVTTSSVQSVELAPAPPQVIQGHVSLDGRQSGTPDGQILIQLETLRIGAIAINRAPPSPPTGAVRADGTFSISGVLPGEYELVTRGLSAQMYVKEARFGDVNALERRLQIFGDRPNPSLEITFSTSGGQVTGTVLGPGQTASKGALVVLIPDQYADRRNLYKSVVTDGSGRFRVDGVPPGTYRIFAWESVTRFSYFDPAFVRPFEASGKLVQVNESATIDVELDLIPTP
jgi:hypothetical protein